MGEAKQILEKLQRNNYGNHVLLVFEFPTALLSTVSI